tara:strand:+ start:15550 stop:16092 length:543 start_codon:yes stop_codon:yes gene_type:complete
MIKKTAQPINWPLVLEGLRGISNLPSKVREFVNNPSKIKFQQSASDPKAVAYVSTEDTNQDGVPDMINIVVPLFNNAFATSKLSEFEKGSSEYQDIISRIASTLIHEVAHLDDFNKETGDFPGGEAVAESAERAFSPIFASTIKTIDKCMVKDLCKLADRLDSMGHNKLADEIDEILKNI